MIKAVIFDFDGTLADSFPLAIECITELAKEKNANLNIKNFEKLKDKTIYDLIKHDFKISKYKLPFYIKKIKEKMLTKDKKIKLFKGIKTIINKLEKKYKVYILSSNYEQFIKDVLKKNKVNIDEVFPSSSIFGKSKSINKLLKEKKLNKNEIIYVGDEIRDIEACKKINVKIISVTWGFNSKKILEKYKPDYLIDEPKDLIKII